MADLHWLRPEFLWLLLLIPLLGWLSWHKLAAVGEWRKVIDPALLPYLSDNTQSGSRTWISALMSILLTIAVIAASGPSFTKMDVPVFQRSNALVLVLDLSASMLAKDVQPSRIQRARQKILDILKARNEGVTALIAFAGDAHIVTPLTDDVDTIENLLPALSPEMMPVPGADAEAALNLAAELLGAAGLRNGHILLLTDGMPKFDPASVSTALADAGASLAILGMGTPAGAPIPLPSGGFLRDESGEIVVPTLDTTALANNASALNGRYQTVALDDSDITDLAEPTLEDDTELALDRKTDTWQDQGYWLAIVVAIGLLPLFRRGALAIALLAVLALPQESFAQTFDDLWQTPDQQGARALENGDAATASTLFENPAWKGVAAFEAQDFQTAAQSFAESGDADGLYNTGNALMQAGDYASALRAYEASLAEKPDQEDALKNAELARKLLEQQQQEQEQNSSGENSDPSDGSNEQDQEGEGGEGDQNQDSNEQESDGDSKSSSDNQSDSQENQEGQPDSSTPSTGNAEDQEPQQQDSETQPGEDPLEQQTQEQMAKFNEALEKQQQLEQWLRKVPDDPGGLLQRKFRYQSVQRMRNGEKPDEDVQW